MSPRALSRVPLFCGALALFGMMCLTFVDVMLRSVANAPISGASELTEILQAVVVFSVLPYVSFHNRQISVDLLDNVFPEWTHRYRDAIVNLVFGILLLRIAYRCWVTTMRTFGYGEATIVLHVPLAWIELFVTVCVIAAALCMILRAALLLLGQDIEDTADAV